MLRLSYFVVVAICMLPTLPGLLGVTIASLSYIPPLGLDTFSLAGFAQVWAWHGVGKSLLLSFVTSLFSTILTCLVTFSILQRLWGRRGWRRVEWCLSPLMSMPHVAYAIGFAFLFAPTGLGVRAFFQLFGIDLTGAGEQGFATLVQDPYGLGLIVMLTLKEVPFLLLMSIPVLKQLNTEKSHKVCQSLGYQRHQFWWKCMFSQWLVKMRFPILAVLAYGLSVVDVALILGPTNPPTFSVLVWQWFNDPDLTLLPRASAGACVLFLLAGIMIAMVRAIEWVITKGLRQWQTSGRSGLKLPGVSLIVTMVAISSLIIPVTAIWSVAQRWRFPDFFPTRYSLRFWQYEWSGIVSTVEQSLTLALISASVALLFAIIAHEYRIKYRWQVPGYLIAVPMLIPQLSILFGFQMMTLFVGGQHYWLWVCWAHMFFAFPFIYLALDGPWRAYNPGFTRVALSLGKTPLRAFFAVKVPQLFSAIAFAWAVGISVSLAQYLPTLMLGAGRISTLTTEAVALSSGFDRRVTAIYALWQALLPLLFFVFAITLSRATRWRSKFQMFKGSIINESVSKKTHHS
ncbi:ABC transporter permease [Vibrio sp. WXL103]|uniref:ABC transporter permease n=1 Tax=Vibrio sp. WXL103 TaxID=3450710 RepID=UPI003EC85E95